MPEHKISEQLLASFIDGTTSPQETDWVNQQLLNDPQAFAEYCLASKVAFILDDNPEGELNQLTSGPAWNMAAGIASAIASGAGISGLISSAHNVVPFMENHENFTEHGDRFYHPGNSIPENSNHLVMDNYFHTAESNPIQQQYNDTCAIKSQQLILNDFGVPVTEDQLVQQAEQFNIYAPGTGTQPQDVGKLLEINGVHCTQHENATVYDLTSALAQGQKVIIGVDSSELWDNGLFSGIKHQFQDYFNGEKADHALIVAGIDTTDPNHVQVILTDPGSGEEAARYPMDQFLDAWHDSGNFMVTTDTPAPLAYNPEMVNFDYVQGHLPSIGQMPYEYFEQHVLSVAQGIESYPQSVDLLHHDFSSLLHGDSFSLSHDLFDSIDQIPGDHVHDLSFGNQHMADYYHGWAEHHEKLAQYDIDHGNLDSAQNHLRYADDAHNHAMDEMDDITDNQ